MSSAIILDDLNTQYLNWCLHDVLMFGENGHLMNASAYDDFEKFLTEYPNVMDNKNLCKILLYGDSYKTFIKSSGLGEKLSAFLKVSNDTIKTNLIKCTTFASLLSNATVIKDVVDNNSTWADITLASLDFVVTDYLVKNVKYIKNLLAYPDIMDRVFIDYKSKLTSSVKTSIKADTEIMNLLKNNYPDVYTTING